LIRSTVENKRPDLSDIGLFVEVAKRRSFSRAAEALGLPNSSLSRRISRLERAVGVTLLHRSSRRVELTDLGRKYFERCEKIVEDAEAAHDQLVRESSSPKGKIRMSVPVDFGLIFIAPALVEFARMYPDLTFDVDMSPRRVDLLAEHYDLAIRVGDLEDSSSLVTRRLATVEVSLYASPAYLKAASVPQTPADLSAHSCLRMLLPEPGLPWVLRDEKTQVNAIGESRFSINNLSMLRELTVSGVGIGAFDAVVADADISRGRLQRVLPGWSMPPLPISLLTPGARLPRRVRMWVDFIAERLRCFDCGTALGSGRTTDRT
jgi:DNA-binding transcriptional LysR family regulator